jgi:HD-GYP domain-containing protein (c-di-GMP phosphodiesterase class II)
MNVPSGWKGRPFILRKVPAMEHPHTNPNRELFVGIYATKLKELRGTPYCFRDFSELERMALRCVEAMEKAATGDTTWLERYIGHVVLQLGREGFRSWQLIQGFNALHETTKSLPGVLGEFSKSEDLILWAIVRFSQLYEELQTVQGLAKMVESLTVALDSKEQYTSSHCRSVQKITEKIGRVMGMDLSLPALLHDVGKIHVPDRILTKGGPLNAEERVILQQHPYHSFRIVCPLNPEVASVCLRHHERPDGGGYPLGETEVRVEANVIAAADTLHAICSRRSYRNFQRLDVALAAIRKNRGTQFLPEVVDAVDKAYGDMAGLLASFSPAVPKGEPLHG